MSICKSSFRLATALLISSSLFTTALMAADKPAEKAPEVKAAPAAPAASVATAPQANLPQLDKMDRNTLLATVNNQKITLGDALDARQLLPPQLSQIPFNYLLPTIVSQLIKQRAILDLATKENVQNDPEVQKQLKLAHDNIVQSAYLMKTIKPKINDASVKEYYNTHYANQAPKKEAHIRHILVENEAQAVKIIKELKGGANFSKLALKYSKDKSANSQNGGDLGWVKQDDLVPEFSKAAFAMKPGTFSQTPVKTQFGWHIIQLIEMRDSKTPTLDQVNNEIREQMLQENIQSTLDDAVKKSTVSKEDKTIEDLSGQKQNPDKK